HFREMGVLPEALMNYLALLGWAPTGGQRETFTAAELIKEFQLERVTASPAVFDMEKLSWLNRHYIKLSSIDRLVQLAIPYFRNNGLLPYDEELGPPTLQWLGQLVGLFAPAVDRLEQLPERSALVFHYDALAAISSEENRALLNSESGRKVVAAFSAKIEELAQRNGSITTEHFKQVMNAVKQETGAKGKELFHPVRIMLTGSHSGPEFDRLVPIIENGSKLSLPTHVMSVHQRVRAFLAARG
ncbi:MAG TPA: glutamate--tRNA ligase family protein, partial [Terriglobales bacterium]